MDQIIIKGLEVFANHGVYEAETFLGQKFIVDVILYTDTRKAGLSDELSDSVSYGDVSRFIAKQMQCQNDKLLEKAAERIADGILKQFPLIQKVTFTIKKPWAPIKMHAEYTAVSITRGWHKVYLGLGSNMGDKKKYIMDAVAAMSEDSDHRNIKLAPLIETEPYGYTEQDSFINSVLYMETLNTPEELLEKLHKLETAANRERIIHWGPRTLDLDILLYDDLITSNRELVIPHPEIEKRMFVLEPLCELNPYGVHPLLKKRFCELKTLLEKNI